MSNNTTTMSFEISTDIEEELQRIARVTGRTTSWLAQEALRSFAALYDWQTQAITQGIADADAGRLVDHEEVATWLESWGSDQERPAPRCD